MEVIKNNLRLIVALVHIAHAGGSLYLLSIEKTNSTK